MVVWFPEQSLLLDTSRDVETDIWALGITE